MFLASVGAAGIGAAVLLERALWHWGWRPWVLRFAVAASFPLALLAAGAQASRDLRLIVNAVAQDGRPIADGRVKLELGRDSWTADLSSGAAVFDSIPRHLGSRPLSLSIEVPGLELAEEAPRAFPADGTLTVRLRSIPPPLTRVDGMVVDFEDQPVRGAVVDFDGLAQVVTDEHGRFQATLTSPPRSTVRVTVRHGGKVRHEDDYTVPNDLTLRFRR